MIENIENRKSEEKREERTKRTVEGDGPLTSFPSP
jgi:hypothetical protein